MELKVIIEMGLNNGYAVPRYKVQDIKMINGNIRYLLVTVFDSLVERYEDLNMNFPC